MQNTQLSGEPKPAPLSGANSPIQNQKCQILAKKGFLIAKNLTSGVALLVYSKEFRLGVLLHLPSFSTPASLETEAQSFSRSAIALILSEFQALGVSGADLLTYAVGGSESGETSELSNATLKRTLRDQGITLSACDLGGHQSRSIWMDVENGRTIIRSQALKKSALTADALSVAS
jgi:chemotaxis receptor (MCP) glutamine deamidase CheD